MVRELLGVNDTIPMVMGQRLDCSGIQLQMCDSFSNNMDTAIMLIGIGILLMMIRKPLDWIASRWEPFCIVSNYMDNSALPGLMIMMGFIFMAFTRWFI